MKRERGVRRMKRNGKKNAFTQAKEGVVRYQNKIDFIK